MESKQKRQGNLVRSLLFYLMTVILSVAAVSGTLAWLSYIRQLQTATLIDVPEIYIEGPEGENSQLLEIGDIDVTKGENHREYVFRIVASSKSKYRLQFAYTTNVPFKYTIYPATTERPQSGEPSSITIGTQTYYYGSALNGPDPAKTQNTHNLTYGDRGNYVHPDAEPLYWQSDIIDQNDTLAYYVLRVSWDIGLKNNKETDMVYLTVKTVSE